MSHSCEHSSTPCESPTSLFSQSDSAFHKFNLMFYLPYSIHLLYLPSIDKFSTGSEYPLATILPILLKKLKTTFVLIYLCQYSSIFADAAFYSIHETLQIHP